MASLIPTLISRILGYSMASFVTLLIAPILAYSMAGLKPHFMARILSYAMACLISPCRGPAEAVPWRRFYGETPWSGSPRWDALEGVPWKGTL
jgi:hypothetical protein